MSFSLAALPVPLVRLRWRSGAVVVLTAVAAAACAPSSRIDVFHSGDVVGAAPNAYVSPSSGEAGRDLAAHQAVERQLNQLGWSTASASPDWKVETTYVVRPNSAGAFEGVDPVPDGNWLVQPERRPWWERKSSIHALSVRLVKPATGEETGRATAHAHVAGPPADDLLDQLARSAVAGLLNGAETATR